MLSHPPYSCIQVYRDMCRDVSCRCFEKGKRGPAGGGGGGGAGGARGSTHGVSEESSKTNRSIAHGVVWDPTPDQKLWQLHPPELCSSIGSVRAAMSGFETSILIQGGLRRTPMHMQLSSRMLCAGSSTPASVPVHFQGACAAGTAGGRSATGATG